MERTVDTADTLIPPILCTRENQGSIPRGGGEEETAHLGALERPSTRPLPTTRGRLCTVDGSGGEDGRSLLDASLSGTVEIPSRKTQSNLVGVEFQPPRDRAQSSGGPNILEVACLNVCDDADVDADANADDLSGTPGCAWPGTCMDFLPDRVIRVGAKHGNPSSNEERIADDFSRPPTQKNLIRYCQSPAWMFPLQPEEKPRCDLPLGCRGVNFVAVPGSNQLAPSTPPTHCALLHELIPLATGFTDGAVEFPGSGQSGRAGSLECLGCLP
ncbi:uncharacterized protein An03g05280 [Aspergillus niger]|uniref:Contig An03c0160, genomic contig n=2 Tax=Aspergillus niger TaxID=5061 RepID=A2QH20_ASPNC|nr:uncharacterized protein An03g05280 [Aspergillus niger]CAK49180.1 unnamed protein product [Aspergillus niger]